MIEPARIKAPSVGRRRFVLWLGGAGLLPFASSVGSLLGLSLGLSDAGAQSGAASTRPATPPAALPAPDATKISEEARALHGVIMARYGKDLDDAQAQGLLEAIDGGVSSGQALRKAKLANAVEPATAFAATPLAVPAPTAATTKGGR